MIDFEILAPRHKKSFFDCGHPELNNHLQHYANQDMKRKVAVCFVLTNLDNNHVIGFYTLANYSINRSVIPESIQKKLPTYPSIPTTILGRLAVDVRYKGQGIGKVLLIDALKRSFEASLTLGSYAVIVDPIDEDAQSFYQKFGFVKLPNSGKQFLPMQTIAALFNS